MALYLYDAISMYMSIVDTVVRAGLDFKNGKLVYSQAQNRIFKGEPDTLVDNVVTDRSTETASQVNYNVHLFYVAAGILITSSLSHIRCSL